MTFMNVGFAEFRIFNNTYKRDMLWGILVKFYPYFSICIHCSYKKTNTQTKSKQTKSKQTNKNKQDKTNKNKNNKFILKKK